MFRLLAVVSATLGDVVRHWMGADEDEDEDEDEDDDEDSFVACCRDLTC